MPAQKSRDTIGQTRTWILGRALVGVYFLTIGVLLLTIGLILAAIYAVLDAIVGLIFNRPANRGRTLFQALAAHQIALGKYTLGMGSYPGLIPRLESGRRNSRMRR